MLRIDAHQHFWKYDPVKDRWITDEMKVLRNNFLPSDLKPILQENKIDGCVAIQADQSEAETDFLIACASDFDFIMGVVGWVDLQSDRLKERLDHYSAFKKLKGFRHILQAEPQRDLMLTEKFRKGIASLSNYEFTYDILIFPDQLRFVNKLVSGFPRQKFVINHLGKPGIKSGKMEQWQKYIKEIASFENVYCKLSGFVTEGDWYNWKDEDFHPYFDTVLNAFGTNRIMFGSDWPVCLVAARYEEVLHVVENYFSSFSTDEQSKIFGSNATAFYNLD